MQYRGKVVDHLGLVAGMVDELGIIESIHQVITQEREKRHLSIGDNRAGIPMAMEPLSGNSSDKTSFVKTIEAHIENLTNTCVMRSSPRQYI